MHKLSKKKNIILASCIKNSKQLLNDVWHAFRTNTLKNYEKKCHKISFFVIISIDFSSLVCVVVASVSHAGIKTAQHLNKTPLLR